MSSIFLKTKSSWLKFHIGPSIADDFASLAYTLIYLVKDAPNWTSSARRVIPSKTYEPIWEARLLGFKRISLLPSELASTADKTRTYSQRRSTIHRVRPIYPGSESETRRVSVLIIPYGKAHTLCFLVENPVPESISRSSDWQYLVSTPLHRKPKDSTHLTAY